MFCLFWLLCFVYADVYGLTINLFFSMNGKGSQQDGFILKEAIESLGHSARCYEKPEANPAFADINVFFESFNEKQMSNQQAKAPNNWFIPNPELYWQPFEELERFNLILCRTKQAERIFTTLGKPTYYLGFTSVDCYRPDIKKHYEKWIHIAGGSGLKGTKSAVLSWMANRNFPHLMILMQEKPPKLPSNVKWHSNRFPEYGLRFVQNECGIHLCASEAEGYGHYLVEALSTKAVVITTDAPPMNEFIQDKRCLVPYSSCVDQFLGVRYIVDPDALANTVKTIMRLSQSEKEAIGEQNRAFYLQKREEFKENLRKLLEATA